MSSAAAALSGSDCVERCIRLVFFLVMQSLEPALHNKQGAVDISLSWMLYALQ